MIRLGNAVFAACRFLRCVKNDRSALALLEFAFTLPILLLMSLGGAELTHYVTVRMQISQIALHIADNAARMGNGPQLSAKNITETDINDVLIGSQLQSGSLDLQKNGRIILSDLEPVANPNTANKFKIGWQRCYGQQSHASSYGSAGDTNLDGIGPTGQLVTSQDDNATMFVEVYYVYKPLISLRDAPTSSIREIASMPVRDRRNLVSGIDNTADVDIAAC